MLERSDPKNRLTAARGEHASATPGEPEASIQPTVAKAGADRASVRDACRTDRRSTPQNGEQRNAAQASDAGTLPPDTVGRAGGTGGDGATGPGVVHGAAQATKHTPAREDMPREVRHGRDGKPGEGGCASHTEREGPVGLHTGETSPSWCHDWLQLSHELRTPLNAILGNIELLLDGSAGPLAAPARACIGDIQSASRQLLKQVQPLLLLVQARTSGAIATRMPLDLLALVRQASADAASAAGTAGAERTAKIAASAAGGAAAGLVIAGDPIWLGALAASLVAVHAASPRACGPLSIVREADGCAAGRGASDVVLRAWWDGLDPAAASPLPLALIDAVANLHGGRIVSFCRDGLRLRLPADVVV